MEELGKALFTVVPIILSITILALVVKVILAWRRKPEQNNVAKVVDAAMEENVPAEPGAYGKYTWSDLQRDLHDPKMTFDEILEKCGGVLPEQPKDVKEISKEEAAAMQADPKQDPQQKERCAQLQEWFGKQAERNRILNVVNPPPLPPPVVTLRGQTVRCPYCNGSGRRRPGYMGSGFTTASRFGEQTPAPMPGLNASLRVGPPSPEKEGHGDHCGPCNGHGYVVISGA